MTLTKERVELKERAEHPPIEALEEPKLLKDRAEPAAGKPAPPPPTGRRLFVSALFGLIALVAAIVAIAVLATRSGDDESDPATEQELATIATEDWVLPEISIPVQVRVPTADWELPEMSVADGTEAAAHAQALGAYGLPEMSVADGTEQAWIDNYELPEMSVADGTEQAWIDNYELPEMSVADGMDAAAEANS